MPHSTPDEQPAAWPVAPPERRRDWCIILQAALILLAGWLVFSPALHGHWLWDDDSEITENPILRDPAGWWRCWLAPTYLVDYFPLKTSVQWLQWQAWEYRPFGYHATSVGLHLLSALLLWRVLKKLGLRLAWLGGLLFVLHPVVVESVAWIAELKNTLSLPLLLLAMGAWLDYDHQGRRSDYLRALLLFLAAMLCKSSVVMFPVVLLLHGWWKRGRIAGKDFRTSAAFFAISLGLGVVTWCFQRQRAINWELIPAGGFFSRLAGAGHALMFYAAKAVLPVEQLPIYPRWLLNPPSPIQFLPWLVIGAVLAGMWVKRATWGRHALFGGGCFLLNLVPVLGFVSMSYMRIAWVADQFIYLPLTGLIGLAVAGAGTLETRLAAPLRQLAWGALAVILSLLAVQSRRYAGCFASQKTLWTYTLQHNPGAWLAHNNLGNVLETEGRLPEARRHYEDALRLEPHSAITHYNMGNVLVRMDRLPDAAQHYQAALRLSPKYAQAHNNLGNTFLQLNRLPEAIRHYQEALRLQPAAAQAHYTHYNLGNALLQSGRWPEAIGEYAAAVELKPDFAEAHYDLGLALFQAGRWTEALHQYEVTLSLRPDDGQAHNKLGISLVLAGRWAEAADHFKQALRINPNFTDARENLNRLRLMQLKANGAPARP
jgi:tetratricopeptide (TPR) repeat protein